MIPYFGLRSYQDGGEHYDGQIGAEATPSEFVDALIAATREMVRVLKPSGSIFVNLGDKYASNTNGTAGHRAHSRDLGAVRARRGDSLGGIPTKSLIGVPWRYALRCIDDLGLILRAEIVWAKPNGLPESVTDRVRRSHETWFHFVKQPRYFSAVDEVREAHIHIGHPPASRGGIQAAGSAIMSPQTMDPGKAFHPLGKLPGSVWDMPLGTSLVRAILEAVSAGALTAEEGERIWTCASDSCGTWTPPATAGSGPDGKTLAVTARPLPTSSRGARTGRTESHTGCSSAPSQTDSHSTTHAATSRASGRTTSNQSPGERTSDAPTLSEPPAGMDTPSRTPTSNGRQPGSITSDAARATSQGSQHDDSDSSVWRVPTQPLRVPHELGIDHFAAFPMEFPRRIIRGWSPSGVCVECGEGRRPVTDGAGWARGKSDPVKDTPSRYRSPLGAQNGNKEGRLVSLTGYACACPTPTAPTTPAVVLDPFGGTGTTALMAKALGRRGVSVDLSRDYCRLAEWRTNDPGELARAMQVEKPPAVDDQQGDLLEMLT